MTEVNTIWRRIVDATTMFFTSLVCLMLLFFVAHGTVTRIYEQLLVDKLVAQGQLVQSGIETYLRPGLPLRQYIGFQQISGPMVLADPLLEAMVAQDVEGEAIFSSGEIPIRTLPPTNEVEIAGGVAKLRTSEQYVQVVLPLRNKFERVGDLVMSMDRAKNHRRINSEFLAIIGIAIGASAIFALVVIGSSGASASHRKRNVAIAFTATFLVAAAAVVLTMINIFSEGAQSKGRALTDSLGQRLDDIFAYGLQIEQIEGLEEVLDNYKRLNPDISALAITVNNRVLVHTNRAEIGRYWTRDPDNHQYTASLVPAGHVRAIEVVLSQPKSIAYWQVARNVKNFAALFVASAFIAYLFMQVVQAAQEGRAGTREPAQDWRRSIALELVKPVYFMAVLIDHLSYSFLPQLISHVVETSHLPAGNVALPFMAFYLCFALALMPAGRLDLTFGSRPVVLIGLMLSAAGLLAMAMAQSFPVILAARACSGVGQGMLFIGLQSYVLSHSAREHRTKANSIIVFGFQAGMISGMAIGSLLVGQIGASGVFWLAGVIGAVLLAYSLMILPEQSVQQQVSSEHAPTSREIWREIGAMLCDLKFVKTFLLIGVPAKAVLTGIVLFAMPLLLHARGFAQEDIGQITMIYAACVIFSSTFASRIADRTNGTKAILVWGALITAAGLVTVALSGSEAVLQSPSATSLSTLLVVAGIAVVGIAHGFINAPVVTHVTETPVAVRIGAVPVAAAYRFLERAGHTLGPIIMGQLFLHFGQTPLALAWVGVAVAILGLIFSISARSSPSQKLREEYVQ